MFFPKQKLTKINFCISAYVKSIANFLLAEQSLNVQMNDRVWQLKEGSCIHKRIFCCLGRVQRLVSAYLIQHNVVGRLRTARKECAEFKEADFY